MRCVAITNRDTTDVERPWWVLIVMTVPWSPVGVHEIKIRMELEVGWNWDGNKGYDGIRMEVGWN